MAAPVMNFKGAREGAIPPKYVVDPAAERAAADGRGRDNDKGRESGRDRGRDRGSAKGNVERGRVFVIVEIDDGVADREIDRGLSYNWKGSVRGSELDIFSTCSEGPGNFNNKLKRKSMLTSKIKSKRNESENVKEQKWNFFEEENLKTVENKDKAGQERARQDKTR